ncbi:MAG TPA: DUF488 domain-containing protein [Gammaproteobacteria bacterium]
MTKVTLKRVYEPASRTDGCRILVDRIWPRGLTKTKAAVDLWLKDVAPSTNLRKWFGHRPERWTEFRQRYLKELRAGNEAAGALLDAASHHRHVTLLFSARDEKRNQAVVLQAFLKRKLTGGKTRHTART